MARTSTRTITEPEISLDDIVVMTTKQARAALIEFCTNNGFNQAARDGAFHLFRLATKTPGERVTVPTTHGQARTIAVHDCMQAITDSPVAHALAQRTFDAAPGTRYDHSMTDNACELANVCTNAPRR